MHCSSPPPYLESVVRVVAIVDILRLHLMKIIILDLTGYCIVNSVLIKSLHTTPIIRLSPPIHIPHQRPQHNSTHIITQTEFIRVIRATGVRPDGVREALVGGSFGDCGCDGYGESFAGVVVGLGGLEALVDAGVEVVEACCVGGGEGAVAEGGVVEGGLVGLGGY